ncbi:MAG TPA: O-antigen ligase family protein [Puia sp.]|nr:O-antigen ligase family protein [Puia sp.]
MGKIFFFALAAGFVWALIFKPNILAVLLFALVLGDINLDVPGLPFNLRAILSIFLLGRIIWKKQVEDHPPFLLANFTVVMICFFLYFMMTSWANDLLDFSAFKEFVTTFLCAYVAYYFFFETKNSSLLQYGMMLGGTVCLADLIYTYRVVGSFPINRLIDVYTGKINAGDYTPTNHNFFAYVCALIFVYFFNEFMRGKLLHKWMWVVLPAMLIGTIMSTGRTGLLVMILLMFYIFYDVIRGSKEGARRVAKFITVAVMSICIGILGFQTISTVFDIDTKLAENMSTRLIDEPVAVINKHLGYNYNANALNSMEWREEASDIAYNTFMSLSPKEQIFGIGSKGFYARNFGHGFNAHNGIFLLLIEGGLIGFSIYFIMIFLLIRKVMKFHIKPSSYFGLIFILLFTVSNNNEMTAATAFLIIGTLMAELELNSQIGRLGSITTV